MSSHLAASFWLVASLYDNSPSQHELENLTISLEKSLSNTNDSLLNTLHGAIAEALSSPDLLNQTQQDHIRLIAGVEEGYGITPPYETLYRPTLNPTLTTGKLSSIYSTWGVLEQLQALGSVDFIATELRFVGLMLYSQDNSSKQKAVHEFAENHLSLWIRKYLTKAKESAKTNYYISVFEITSLLYDAMKLSIDEQTPNH